MSEDHTAADYDPEQVMVHALQQYVAAKHAAEAARRKEEQALSALKSILHSGLYMRPLPPVRGHAEGCTSTNLLRLEFMIVPPRDKYICMNCMRRIK